MFKYVLSAALLMAASVAVAETTPATTSASNDAIPVIVKNEPIGPNLCRLHFEDATTKDVACDSADSKKS